MMDLKEKKENKWKSLLLDYKELKRIEWWIYTRGGE